MGDFKMKTYYIFIIKENIYNIYKNNSNELYKILYNLYKLNEEDFKYGINLFKQICEIIKVNKIKKYLELLENIRIGKNKYLIKENNSLIIIKPSRIIYKCENINKDFIYILNNYNKRFFICNFNKKEYNWINNIE